MHWTRGCKEIILSIDAHTTSLIYEEDDNSGDDDGIDENYEATIYAILPNIAKHIQSVHSFFLIKSILITFIAQYLQ